MGILSYLKGLFRKDKILFADLDGTLIVTKSGKTFPENTEDWQLKEGIETALMRYNPTHLFIVSNQGGIEKGFLDKKGFIHKMYAIVETLQSSLPDTRIEFSFETSNDKSNPRRKPNTGMLEEYYHDYYGNNDFDKKNALMIGDASGLKGQFSDSDYQCAKNFGIRYLDVDYFIRGLVPCPFCNMKCKYEQPETYRYIGDCDLDRPLEYYMEQYKDTLA